MADTTIRALHNGSLVDLKSFNLSVGDRAFMFGDAVYEVMRVYQGRPFLLAEHLSRFRNSLKAMEIENVPDLREQISLVIKQNQIVEGMVYIQVSRGVAPRNHSYYELDLTPQIFMYAKPFLVHPAEKEAEAGITLITHEDIRWAYCYIKTVNLLPNCLVQTKAHKNGADDAVFIRDGFVTECTSSNIFVVKDGVVKTPPLSRAILPGIRRQFVINKLLDLGIPVLETMIKKDELFMADEIFITSTIKEAIFVKAIDGHVVKGPPSMAKRVRKLIVDEALKF